jgi:oligoribonuclease NrnB/cAMP/cGMP phosphodiesterase (DHH superfamily)
MKLTRLLPEEVNYVIYHSPCCDGTGSGLAAWKYLSENFPDREVIYKPMRIGAPPPNDVDGKNVLICDYSYKKNVLLDLIPRVNKLLVIDHHKSAEKEFEEIDDVYKIFKMENSGAVLTWQYFYPGEPIPLLFQYIQDRDIWTKALPNTDNFFAAISILPHEFEVYAQYLDEEKILDLINNTGVKYGELNKYNADNASNYAVPKFCKIKGKYYIIGYVNTTVLKSDIGNMIFDKLPLIDFSVAYSINDNSDSTSFSLRSTNKHVDVSVVASSFNGGGHREASGMRLDYITNTLPGKVYDYGEIYKRLDKVYYKSFLIENINLNVIYMHSTVYRHHLGAYFLQTKYQINDNERIQVGSCLNEENKQHLDLAAIWRYDPVEDMSEYIITFDEDLNNETKDNFIKNMQNVTGAEIEYINEKNMKVSFNGLVKTL